MRTQLSLMFGLGVLAGLAFPALRRSLSDPASRYEPDYAAADYHPSRGAGESRGPVRDAGPSQMEAPPRHWDMVDEASDESFPASDSPATY